MLLGFGKSEAIYFTLKTKKTQPKILTIAQENS